MDRSKYPANWQELRAKILARADNRCEQCGVLNRAYIYRDITGLYWWEVSAEEAPRLRDEQGVAVVRIVLTVAHLDHDPQHNNPANLRALCQRCHLRHDRGQHAANARQTRARKRGQLLLFEE